MIVCEVGRPTAGASPPKSLLSVAWKVFGKLFAAAQLMRSEVVVYKSWGATLLVTRW